MVEPKLTLSYFLNGFYFLDFVIYMKQSIIGRVSASLGFLCRVTVTDGLTHSVPGESSRVGKSRGVEDATTSLKGL